MAAKAPSHIAGRPATAGCTGGRCRGLPRAGGRQSPVTPAAGARRANGERGRESAAVFAGATGRTRGRAIVHACRLRESETTLAKPRNAGSYRIVPAAARDDEKEEQSTHTTPRGTHANSRREPCGGLFSVGHESSCVKPRTVGHAEPEVLGQSQTKPESKYYSRL